MKYLILILTLLLANQSIAQQKIYKWTDANGNVHYSEEKPLNTQVKEVKVSTGASKPNMIQQEPAQEDKNETEPKSKDQIAVDEYNKKEKERITSLQNKQNCEIAKKNLATIQSTNRVRKIDPITGESVRLGDDQRKKALEAAKKLVRDLCK